MKIHKKNPMIMKIFFGPGLPFGGYAHIQPDFSHEQPDK